MPTEPKLPAELSDVETLLKQFSPTDSEINRDVLMYQAGWAAATAQAPARTHLLWPAISAAFAASLLLVIALTTRPLQRSGTEPINPRPLNPTQAIAKPTASIGAPEVVRARPVPRKRYSPKAPLLAMRERALRQDYDDLPLNILSDDSPPPVDITHRQLLREFLPALRTPSFPRNNGLPLWSRWNLGETS